MFRKHLSLELPKELMKDALMNKTFAISPDTQIKEMVIKK